MRPSLALAGVALVLGLACAGPAAVVPSPAPTGPALRPASELQTDCFGFPRRGFNRRNHAEAEVRLATGDRAVDFTLRDTDGREVRLADLLQDKPVLLLQGNLTCPRFQKNRSALEQTLQRFGDDVNVVLVYNVEAHPGGDDPSPYRGDLWQGRFSDRPQARSYQERLRSAREVARSTEIPVLVDPYDAGEANPIWCTYGTCPSCSWLIRPDGVIEAHHDWHDPPTMDRSIELLLQRLSP